jgi:hypothetical protein
VTQGAEIYKGRPIIYSLGNFVFDGFELPAARVGWLLSLSLDRKGVVAWHTVEARMDEEGLPSPAEQAETPCGKRGDRQPAVSCRCAGGSASVSDQPVEQLNVHGVTRGHVALAFPSTMKQLASDMERRMPEPWAAAGRTFQAPSSRAGAPQVFLAASRLRMAVVQVIGISGRSGRGRRRQSSAASITNW